MDEYNDISQTKIIETILNSKSFSNVTNKDNYQFRVNMKIPGLDNTIYCCNLLSLGGFASIHKIYNTKENIYYAMKIPRNKYYNQIDVCRMFLEEANKLLLIEEHPNIVSYKNFINWNNIPLIITNYIEGFSLDNIITLDSKITNHFIMLSDLIGAFIEISRGMVFLHENNEHSILHLDLKPSNIMLDTNDNCLKIIDFGISRTLSKSTSNKVDIFDEAKTKIIGTYPYMSPEHFDGLDKCKKTSDIYSMGIILYEIVTGSKPFFASNKNDFAHLHKSKIISNVPTSNKLLEKIILKCLKKTPADRYQNFNSLLNDLENLYNKLVGIKYPVKNKPDSDYDLIIKANKNLNLGQYKKALHFINLYLETNSNSVEALISKALILYKIHSYKNALLLIEKILSIENTNLKAKALKGHILLEKEKYSEASETYNNVLSIDSISYSYLKGPLADSYFHQMKCSLAIKTIDTALYDEPNQYDFISVKSRILFYTNNENHAISFLEKYLTKDWQGLFHSLWGNAMNDIGKGSQALSKLLKFAKIYVETANVYHTIGNIYFKTENFNKALLYYKKAYYLSSEKYEYLSSLLNCYSYLDDKESLYSLFEKFKENKIINGAIYNIFANSFFNINDYSLALTNFNNSLVYENENSNFASDLLNYYVQQKNYTAAKYQIENWNYSFNSNFLNSIGLYYFYIKDYENSEKFYYNAITKMPFNSTFAGNLISLYNSQKKYLNAVEFALNWIKSKRGCEYFHFSIGESYFYIEDFKNAVKSFKNALSINPYNLSYLGNLIKSLIKENNIDEAISISFKIIQKQYKKNIYYFSNEVGIHFLNMKQPEAALKFFKHSLNLNKSNLSTAINIINTYRLEKKYNHAIKFLNDYITTGYNNYKFWISCGYLYHETKNYIKVYDSFKKALHLQPDSYECARYFFYAIIKLELYSEGIEFGINWLKNNITSGEIYNFIGLCYYNKKLYNEAYKNFSLSICTEPKNPFYSANFYCTLLYLKKDLEANKYLFEWLKNNKANDYFFNTLGVCFYNLKDYKNSCKFLYKALKLNPTNQAYAFNYFRTLTHFSNLNLANIFAEKWSKKNKLGVDFLNQLGLFNFDNNNYQKASHYFLKALNHTPDNATIAANYIISLKKLNLEQIAYSFYIQWQKKYIPNDIFIYASKNIKKY